MFAPRGDPFWRRVGVNLVFAPRVWAITRIAPTHEHRWRMTPQGSEVESKSRIRRKLNLKRRCGIREERLQRR